jgi:hypothetical protein
MTTYYNFQVWNGTEQELFSYDLFENIDDMCDEVEEIIYEYTGESVKVDRYDIKRSMTPCDTYIYYSSPKGYSFIINMLEVKKDKRKRRLLDMQ